MRRKQYIEDFPCVIKLIHSSINRAGLDKCALPSNNHMFPGLLILVAVAHFGFNLLKPPHPSHTHKHTHQPLLRLVNN